MVAVSLDWVLPDAVDSYVAGGVLASTGWLLYLLMIESSGILPWRHGIEAEEWTVWELRKLRRHGWHVVNHVMLVDSDIDHAVIGPGGMFAVETKYRSDWSRAGGDFAKIAQQAQRAARDLQPRLGLRIGQRVQPVVAIWGPGRHDVNDVFTVDGVAFCRGDRLRSFLLDRPADVPAAMVNAAYDHLDQYVTIRDRGEAAEPTVRPMSAIVEDIYAVTGVTVGCLLVVIYTTLIPLHGCGVCSPQSGSVSWR